jgi:hypothetical protein
MKVMNVEEVAQVYAKKNNIKYDKRTKKEIFILKKKINQKVAVPVSGMDYLNIKADYKTKDIILSGVSFSENVFCNESGYWTFYFSDRYGFNNPDFVWKNKSDSIVMIGDSNVHGGCVERKNSIAGQLRINQKKNVINWFSYDSFFGDYKFIPFIITIIFLIIYDYFNYFKSEKEKEILTKYTYKYDLIDNHPIMFFLLFFCFLPLLLIAFLVIFLKFFI